MKTKKQNKKKGSGSMSSKKTVTLTVNKDLVDSWIEGGLWMMRLIEDGEYVTGVVRNPDGDYSISLERTKDRIDKRQMSFAFMGKDNP